ARLPVGQGLVSAVVSCAGARAGRRASAATSPAAPGARRDDSARPYFLYAGRLEATKGVERLIDAFERRRGDAEHRSRDVRPCTPRVARARRARDRLESRCDARLVGESGGGLL